MVNIIRDFVNFAAIYQDLYSKHLLEEFENVKKEINNKIIPELETC